MRSISIGSCNLRNLGFRVQGRLRSNPGPEPFLSLKFNREDGNIICRDSLGVIHNILGFIGTIWYIGFL